jgi:two-component system, NtrC family, sensor kinase
MFSSIRFKTVAVLITSALATYVGLVNLSDRISFLLPSDGVEWQQSAEGVSVRAVPNGMETPRPGDRLRAINDISIHDLNDYHNVIELLSASPFTGTPAQYELQRGDSRIVVPLEVTLRSQVGLTDYLLIGIGFIYLVIGLLIYLRHGSATGAFHFYLLCLVAFVLFCFRHSGQADGFDISVYWASAVALLLLPPLFLHFCCYFPEPLKSFRQSQMLKPALYFPFALLAALHFAWFAGRLGGIGLPRNQGIALLLDRVYLLHFVVYFVASGLLLVYLRRVAASSITRQQMKWLSYGTVIGTFPFVLLYGIPYMLGIHVSPLMDLSILGLALIPVCFGYAITRFRLMDVDVIVRRGAAYLLASSALLGLYMGIALLLGRAAANLSPESGFFLFAISALLVAFLFAPLRNRIQEQLDRFFYKGEYDYRQSMAEFGRTLASEVDLHRLTERICTRVSRSLNVPRIALFLRDHSSPSIFQKIEAPDAGNGQPVRLKVPESVFADFDRELTPLFVCPPCDEVNRLREQMASLGLHYLQPLRVHGKVLGFLGCSRKVDNELLSSEDLDLVAGLANYAAIAIDNSILYQSLEHKAAQLQQLKAYSENVVESLVAGVAVVSPDGTITVWNSAMERMSGINQAQAVGRDLAQVLPDSLVQTMQGVMEAPGWTVDQTRHLYKTCFPSGTAESRLVNISIAPFVLDDDVYTGTLLLFDDITEKVRLEDQLKQSEKLSSIGLFAAGVAHEVNTPLAGISSYAQMLLKDAPDGSAQQELLKKIERQSFRASNIVNSLLKFARVNDADQTPVNLNSLMLETLSLLEHQLKKSQVAVCLELDPSLPSTLGNNGRLQQVFMNLFLNAKDAMPEGGQLMIRSYQHDSSLVVQVHDTGYGISSQDVKRIYDPFFTTKGVGKGTGLGLSVSYGIIQEHSGRISVESEPGKGTTFTLQLPLKRVN